MKAKVESPAEVFPPVHLSVRPFAYYDRLVIRAGERMPEWFPLFSQPVGYNRPGSFDFKRTWDTNMYLAVYLFAPCAMSIDRVGFVRAPGCDLSQLTANYTWRLDILNKVMASGPIPKAEEGSLEEFMADSARLARPLLSGVTFANPYKLESMMYFGVGLYGKSFVADSDLDLLVFLDGQGTFSVQ